MKKRKTLFILLVITGTLFLFPNFYNNSWKAVEPAYYDEWQIRYDRLVMARLVKNRQDGFFSAGGLLGLGDSEKWNFLSATHYHQYNVYLHNNEFQSYLLYKSNPGFQGVLYGILDKLLSFAGEQKISVFRGVTAFTSALTFGVMFSFIVMEFGFIAGVFMIIFSAFSIWTILPAGSIFWNLWAFFLPFLASTYLLMDIDKKGQYEIWKIYVILFGATLTRVLLSGFDIITSGLIMTTTPIVYYGIFKKWKRSTFIERFLKISVSLVAAVTVGLLIMAIQIASADNTISNVFSYIEDRFGHHFAGNSEYYTTGGIEATKIGAIEITSKYLAMPAINIPWPGEDLQILYSHLLILFALFTIIYFVINRKQDKYSYKAIGLIAATWYGLAAPLSWILIFRPHSIIHTHVNTMGWQMPFTLLGFALCGYVISDLLKRKKA